MPSRTPNRRQFRTRRPPTHTARPLIEALEPRQLLAATPDSLGTDFWVAFMRNAYAEEQPQNRRPVELSLSFTSPLGASVNIVAPGTNFATTCVVLPGRAATVIVPDELYASSLDGVSTGGIHITSDNEISVQGLNHQDYSTDGFLALPVENLGTSYIVATSANVPMYGAPLEFAVAATDDETAITITPSVSTDTRPAGIPYTVSLSRGQVYQLIFAADFTGTTVTSDKPVAVFSGAQLTTVPIFPAIILGAANHLVEQLPPITSWGTHFAIVPLATRNNYFCRVIASENSTRFSTNGTPKGTLNRGGFYEWTANTPQAISADKPVLVVQYACSEEYDGTLGDPFMTLVTPTEQGQLTQVVVAPHPTPPSLRFWNQFVNIWAPQGTIVQLDGQEIAAEDFFDLGDGYMGVSKAIPVGMHTITGNAPVGAMAYGWENYDAYGYPSAGYSGTFTQVANLRLDPAPAETMAGSPQQFSAVATDAQGQPMPNRWIGFFVSGANPTTAYALTDATGRVTFGYAGKAFGSDTITVDAGHVSASTTLFRHSVPVIPAQSLTLASDHPYSGRVEALCPDGHAPILSLLTPPAHGTLQFQADGQFTYTPAPGYSGPDPFSFQAQDSIAASIGTVNLTIRPDPNDAPTDLTLSASSIAENLPSGTPVGTFTTTDPDLGDSFTYTLVGGLGSDDNASFTLSGTTLKTAASFDYETKQSYSIRVRTTDMYGSWFEKAFTISITDTDEVHPAVASVSINDGAVQRSMVTKLVVTFSWPVTLSYNAIQVKRLTGTFPGYVYMSVSNPSGDNKTYILTVNSAGWSLDDGMYDLIVWATRVHDQENDAMVADYTKRFHRLFGDADGNKVVNALDYAKFKASYGRSSADPLFNSALDYDRNRVINALDLAQFRQRYGKSFIY